MGRHRRSRPHRWFVVAGDSRRGSRPRAADGVGDLENIPSPPDEPPRSHEQAAVG